MDVIGLACDWTWACDADHRFVHLSEGFERRTGIASDKVVGRARLDLLMRGAGASGGMFLACLSSREPFRDFTYELIDVEGASRWIAVSGAPAFGEDGAFNGFHGVAREVSALAERFREDMPAGLMRTQVAMDVLDDGFVLWDRDDRLIACNSAFRKHFSLLPRLRIGRTFEEMLSEAVSEGVFPQALGREADFVREKLYERARNVGREVEFQMPDGRWIVRRDTITPDGCRVGVRTDITDYRRREEELAAAMRQAQSLGEDMERTLDRMSLGVVLLDADLNLLLVNRAYFDMWGLSPDSVEVGDNFVKLMKAAQNSGLYPVTEGNWDDYVAERGREIRAGDTASREFLRADGATMIYSVTALSGGKRLLTYYDVSELKQREAELGEALEKARLAEIVIDSVPNAMFVKDAELRYVMANQAFGDLVGLTPADIVGKTDKDVLSPNEADLFEPMERQILETGESYEAEADDELGARVVRKHRVRTRGDKVYIASSIFEVTDLKRQRREAEESRNHLASVLESLPAGVIIYDRDNRFVLANSRIHEALPAMVEAMQPGKTLREAVELAHAAGYFRQSGDGELDAIYDRDREAWITGYMARYDRPHTVFERANPDGRWFQAFDTRQADGTYVGVRVDITELKQRERALEESMARIELFSHVLDELPVATYVKGPDFTFEFVNKAWCEETGVTKEEAIGRSSRDFFGEEAAANFTARDSEVLKSGRMDVCEETLTSRDGRVMHLISRKNRLVGADGGVHLIGSTANITELKNREAELFDARRKAELADRAKSEFLANMSHEIRTPMNGVLGMAELLSKAELGAKERTFVDIIMKSGNALLTIINDILDFSKIDAGQMVLDPAPFDLAEAIEDVATLVSARAKEKDLELIVRVEPGLHDSYVGDIGRIRQIITNLVGNAVKFTETGHVLIEVTGRDLGDRERLTVKVLDTGIGIPADKVDLVFDKFSQVDGSSTRRHEGTGLGLAITSRLVEMMGGSIGVESEEGSGSTFWFELELPKSLDARREIVMPVDVSGARILVVDDNEVNRSILSEQMSAWGFDACASRDGPEALAVLEAAQRFGVGVDCVVLDYQMPGMTGADVARRIRSSPALAGIPLIMLTSVDQSLSQSSFGGVDVDAQLIKPARSAVLLETLVRAIQKQRGRAAGQPAPEGGRGDNRPARVESAPKATSPRKERVGAGAQLDILVAEDNEVNQLVFSQILAESGLSFKIVQNGRLAVEAFSAEAPRIILMDVSMPEMNGLDATAAIRALEGGSGGHVPIIGVTAHALKGDRERCIAAGMDDYLSKPISPRALLDKVKLWSRDEDRQDRLA